MKQHSTFWPGILLLVLFATALNAQITPINEIKPTLTAEAERDVVKAAAQSAAAVAPLSGEAWPLLMPRATQADLDNAALRCQEGDEEESDEEVEEAKAALVGMKEAEMLANPNPPNPFAKPGDAVDAITPVVYSGFTATHIGSGNPPDNTMAISNGGYILTSVNSNIAVYNTAGTNLGSWTLYSFFNGAGAGVVNDFFDPVVLYDSGSDRFVATCIVGRTPSQSRLLIAFSKTNNPLNGWWTYYLPGNILNNSCWLDYPKLACSTAEVYVTGNLFNTSNSFNQAVIYQIPKAAGYAGGSLAYQWWYNIQGSPFTIVPVSYGGSGNYGPGVYLVAHNSASGSQTKFYDLTDNMSATNEQLLYYTASTPSYSIGTNAVQKGTSERLDVGDSRIQGGFYKDGTVHYVFHARGTSSTAYNGIHYHRLNVSTKTVTSKVVWTTNYDLCYPAVAWAGTGTGKDVIITFQVSNSSIYPSVGGVSIDNANNISPSWMYCASGTNFVDLSGSTVTRWGDYLGISRRKNSSPMRIWGAGSFGSTSNQYRARVFQLGFSSTGGPDGSPRSEPDVVTPTTDVDVFPNPVRIGEPVRLAIDVARAGRVRAELYDLQGRRLAEPVDEVAPEGLNHFTVNTELLKGGVYALRIFVDQKLVGNEKLVVVR